MKIAIFSTPFENVAAAEKTASFIMQAGSRGVRLLLTSSTVESLGEKGVELSPDACFDVTSAPSVPEGVDFILSLGGDGTFLRAARWCGSSQIPVAGVNFGHLGYLTTFSPRELDGIIDILEQGNFDIDERSVLKIDLPEQFCHEKQFWPYALNEVALLKTDSASMISIPVTVDSRELAIYRADGLIISTPTGSTGYNLSVGGPILQPGVPAMVLSPIAAHTLTMRPMVISDDCHIEATAAGRSSSFLISIDGISESVPCGTPVKISKAPFTCRILSPKGYSFSHNLRSKLLWGESMVVG